VIAFVEGGGKDIISIITEGDGEQLDCGLQDKHNTKER